MIHAWEHSPEHGCVHGAGPKSGAAMATRLKDQDSAYEYTEYGPTGACNGGHTFECWVPAATVALDRWARRAGIRPTGQRPAVAPDFRRVTAHGDTAGGGS